jgi:hypothetical protein
LAFPNPEPDTRVVVREGRIDLRDDDSRLRQKIREFAVERPQTDRVNRRREDTPPPVNRRSTNLLGAESEEQRLRVASPTRAAIAAPQQTGGRRFAQGDGQLLLRSLPDPRTPGEERLTPGRYVGDLIEAFPAASLTELSKTLLEAGDTLAIGIGDGQADWEVESNQRGPRWPGCMAKPRQKV